MKHVLSALLFLALPSVAFAQDAPPAPPPPPPLVEGSVDFYESADWRIGHAAALTTKVHGILSLKLSHTIRYVNFPPPGFDNTDTITSVALVAKF